MTKLTLMVLMAVASPLLQASRGLPRSRVLPLIGIQRENPQCEYIYRWHINDWIAMASTRRW